MKTLFLFLLLCHVSSAVEHSFVVFLTGSSGIPNVPEFMADAELDGTLVSYCDTNKMTIETKHDWLKKLFKENPSYLELYKFECLTNQPKFFKARINDFKQLFNQTGGIHMLQEVAGCEWHDETGEIKGFDKYGYDGEDLLSFDVKTSTWIALKPQAEQIKLIWDADEDRIKHSVKYLNLLFPEFLKKYLEFGNSSLHGTKLPSVSLLQKTPSSPVSCHATGFFPERSSLFWRKDGEEIHEDVDHGEILPNHDGTFQMSVDLNLSSVTPEDWRRYDCVFQLSGVKDDIVTRLDKDVIRTNSKKPSNVTLPVTAALAVLALVLIAGFIVYKRNKVEREKSPDSDREQTESRCGCGKTWCYTFVPSIDPEDSPALYKTGF